MKTKIDFKALDHADLVFGTQMPSQETQKAFSEFLANRKKGKSKDSNSIMKFGNQIMTKSH